jgi:hypothetical protein
MTGGSWVAWSMIDDDVATLVLSWAKSILLNQLQIRMRINVMER